MPIPFQQEIYRKLVHLSSLWMAAFLYFCPRWPAFIILAVCCVLNVLVEYLVWKKVPFVTPLYRALFGRMLREAPAGRFRMSGAPPVWASCAMCALLFPREAAVPAFAVMLLGDTAAALIGRSFGRHRFANGKSLEGVLAFLAVGWLVTGLAGLLLFHYTAAVYLGAFLGVALASMAELFNKELHVDDNFSIPLVLGGMIRLSMLF